MTRPHRIAVGFFCVFALLVLPGWVLRHDRRARVEERAAELDALLSQNQALRTSNQALHEHITSLSDNGDLLEQEVRERLGWVRANETVVVFHGADTAVER